MVFGAARLLPLEPLLDQTERLDEITAACAAGDNFFIALASGWVGLVSQVSGNFLRKWRSQFQSVQHLAFVPSTGDVLALEVQDSLLFFTGYGGTGNGSFSLPLATEIGALGVCASRSRAVVATGSDINVWDACRGGRQPNHIFELSLEKLLGSGLTICRVILSCNYLAFATKSETFVLHVLESASKEGNESRDPQRGRRRNRREKKADLSDARWRGRRAGHSRDSNLSRSPVGGRDESADAQLRILEGGVKDDGDLVMCLFEDASLPVTGRSGGQHNSHSSRTTSVRYLPTLADDANVNRGGVDDVDKVMALQRVAPRCNAMLPFKLTPSQCRVVLARRCSAGSRITSLQFLGTNERCELLVGTWKDAALYALEETGGSLGASLCAYLQHSHRALFAVISSRRHFLFALTIAGLEVWTLPSGPQINPVLLHRLEMSISGALPLFPHKFLLGLGEGLILLPSWRADGEDVGGTCFSFVGFERPLVHRDNEGDLHPNSTAEYALQEVWKNCQFLIPGSESRGRRASPVLLYLSLMLPSQVYERARATVRAWLDEYSTGDFLQNVGGYYKSVVEGLHEILVREALRAKSAASMKTPSYSSKSIEISLHMEPSHEATFLTWLASFSRHRSMAADCAALLAELCLATALPGGAQPSLSQPSAVIQFERACRWLRESSMSLNSGVQLLRDWLALHSQTCSDIIASGLERSLYEDYILPVLGGGREDDPSVDVLPLPPMETGENLEEILLNAIAYMCSNDQPISILAQFVIHGGRIPWQACVRAASLAKERLEDFEGINRSCGGEAQAAALVLAGYIGCITPGLAQAANESSLLDACLAHPSLVVERMTHGGVDAGPLASALLQEGKESVLVEAIAVICRPGGTGMADCYQGKVCDWLTPGRASLDPVQVLGVLGPAGQAVAARILRCRERHTSGRRESAVTRSYETLPNGLLADAPSSMAVEMFLQKWCAFDEELGSGTADLRAQLAAIYVGKLSLGTQLILPMRYWAAEDTVSGPQWAVATARILAGEGWEARAGEARLCYFNLLLGLLSPRGGSILAPDLLPDVPTSAADKEVPPHWALEHVAALILRVSSEAPAVGLPRLASALGSTASDSESVIADTLLDFARFACDDSADDWRDTLEVLYQIPVTGPRVHAMAVRHIACGPSSDFLASMPDSMPISMLVKAFSTCIGASTTEL